VLITRPEESYRLWCVVVCDLKTSGMRRPWPNGGLSRPHKKCSIVFENYVTLNYPFFLSVSVLYALTL